MLRELRLHRPHRPQLEPGVVEEDLVQARGLSFTASTIALAIGLAWNDGIGTEGWLASLLAVLPAHVPRILADARP